MVVSQNILIFAQQIKLKLNSMITQEIANHFKEWEKVAKGIELTLMETLKDCIDASFVIVTSTTPEDCIRYEAKVLFKEDAEYEVVGMVSPEKLMTCTAPSQLAYVMLDEITCRIMDMKFYKKIRT